MCAPKIVYVSPHDNNNTVCTNKTLFFWSYFLLYRSNTTCSCLVQNNINNRSNNMHKIIKTSYDYGTSFRSNVNKHTKTMQKEEQ